ncbi:MULTISPECIES: hypothetical protein [unclassified Pseudomonas]|uniref:hypothetical protein n=1 Tax=unclassified Pseudomonas TaxID=196821 RepID=UPI000D37F75C|nr:MULTISPECIES: hypothetical protein [unclassified Pseudomonas]RAU45851.1 hypothetical protein DBP26_012825 [Pseudomonas sp. RIT 409]RAU56050.1 hypothetical protein DBY65_002670 [Pseudomonas sp. RIT 412]
MARPYFFINDQMQTYATLKNRVGGNQKFDVLNAHLRNIVVVPGQLVIMGDLSTSTLTAEEMQMMDYADKVRRHLLAQQAGGDGHVVKNYDLLQNVLNYSSLGIGAASGSWEKHLSEVAQTLKDIEQLHKDSLRKGTTIARQTFITQRRVLFSKLDTQLKGIARWGTGMHNKGSIKKMLGISTKSYLHTPEIQGYAARLESIAKASRFLKAGTPIGIGLNGLSTHLEIKEACATGREEVCRKAKYIEGTKLVGSVTGGMVGGTIGAAVLTPLCMVLFGVPTGGWGALGCAVVSAATGGYAGGLGGEWGGEHVGEVIYEWRP